MLGCSTPLEIRPKRFRRPPPPQKNGGKTENGTGMVSHLPTATRASNPIQFPTIHTTNSIDQSESHPCWGNKGCVVFKIWPPTWHHGSPCGLPLKPQKTYPQRLRLKLSAYLLSNVQSVRNAPFPPVKSWDLDGSRPEQACQLKSAHTPVAHLAHICALFWEPGSVGTSKNNPCVSHFVSGLAKTSESTLFV